MRKSGSLDGEARAREAAGDDGAGADAAVPRTEAEITAAAARIGLDIPPACRDGVVANLAVLDGHARIMLGTAPR